ncbi:hypothetical protein GOQ30_11365 [Flavobacterium sp. TP390]|uniref:Uncharacterized protein n=1 Tax=Flavobacterium profundi TaxID=1774945 RepID=A0A6I4IST1_9FLAO|nr:hypothetical protein [Flavobacterium profundi]MVO09757.1 hypothetical protein [Flavobacterium profundi]
MSNKELNFKTKSEVYKDFPKVSERILRPLINETIARVSGISLKEAKDRKIIYPRELEYIYKELE